MNLLAWLLESENPSVGYRALTGLLDLPDDHPQVRLARAAIGSEPAIARLLARQKPGGYWGQPDYYVPKHSSTFWVLSVLADLGLGRDNPAIERGGEFLFAHQRANGSFCRRRMMAGKGFCWEEAPEPCTHARIVRLLIQSGYRDDARTRNGIDWLLETRRQDGMWHCKPGRRGCLRATLDYLNAAVLDPAIASHPATSRAAEIVCGLLMEPHMDRYHVSDEWAILSYPAFGYTAATALDALGRLGYQGDDPRIARAVEFLLGRRLDDGRWPLDQAQSRPPLDFGRPGEANKWVTLDCLIALRQVRLARLEGGEVFTGT